MWVALRRYEGPRCAQDINECVRGTSGCHPNATCTNSPGFYTCRCPPGYTGDGFSCSKDEVQHRSMIQQYSSPGPGKLACSEGKDVLYPEAAPGFAYDPIGALEQSPDRRVSWAGWAYRARAGGSSACVVHANREPGQWSWKHMSSMF